MPLSTLIWEDAIKYMVLNKANVLAYHDNWIVHSATWETAVPSVMMLREYMKPKIAVRFSRTNLYLRDNHTCQYCGKQVENKHATLDHVVPISKGGKSVWDNCVLSCAPCNSHKSDTTRGWKPRIKPYKPDYFELVSKRKRLGWDLRYKDWEQYIA